MTDNIPAGAYQITVTDDHDCTAFFGPYLLDEPDSIVWNLSVENTQNGMSNGSISWLISGGSPPFIPEWSPMEGEQAGQSIMGLPAGEYHLSLIDQKGCSVDTVVTIDESVAAYTSQGASGITLYPLPGDEHLNILHLRDKPFTWSIHEISGKSMARGYSRQKRTSIQCSAFPPGLYLLYIRFAKGSPIVFKVPVIH